MPGSDSFVAWVSGSVQGALGSPEEALPAGKDERGRRARFLLLPSSPRPVACPALSPRPTRGPGPSSYRAQSPLPSPRHRRPGFFSLPRDPESPFFLLAQGWACVRVPLLSPGPHVDMLRPWAPICSPQPWRSFSSIPFLPSLPTVPAFSVVTTLFLCLVWVSNPRWTRFPLFIQSIFAPIPWVLARWDVGGRLCREHSIT